MTRINDSHIGWWCRHDDTGTVHDLVDGPIDTVGHGDHSKSCLIPVFVPLLVPEFSTETRADMEACAEVVVAVDEDGPDTRLALAGDLGEYDCGLGAVRWALCWGPDYPSQWGLRPSSPFVMVENATEADAVLWTVEGKLPGGES